LRRVISLVETHPNAIVFIDEAEKLFGNHRYGEDTFLVGDFQELLDSAFKRSFKGTLILSMNEPQRFNPAFRDRFVEIEFPLPTHEERVQYLTEKTREHIPGLDIEMLSRRLEGGSYRELDRVWEELMVQYLELGYIPDDSYRALIEPPKVMFG